ncbi:hypothetical protein E4656_19135 [Natronospirillum operosum]|uniref:DUF2846 domain-containing protein n=1 Tax=Natronospirillum operosum TaxID=2759953 RepID=A0A4Z0W6X1_9GAMM|nr:hypothetical protein [Natronospirillum operosum]TGG90242.1 hypothetical protein E4656_19135 [Natronospirillum operosum]
MNYRMSTLLVSFLFVLSACSSLPSEPEGDMALLVFPMETSTAPGNSIWWDYQIFAENMDTGERKPFFLRPAPRVEYEIVVLDTGGRFLLNGWNSRNRNNNRVNQHGLSRYATARSGHLNLYPHRLVVRSENNNQRRRFVPMHPQEQEALLEQIRRDHPDMNNWPSFISGGSLED